MSKRQKYRGKAKRELPAMSPAALKASVYLPELLRMAAMQFEILMSVQRTGFSETDRRNLARMAKHFDMANPAQKPIRAKLWEIASKMDGVQGADGAFYLKMDEHYFKK